MRVLFYSTTNLGIEFYRLWQPAEYLRRKGHKTTLVTHPGSDLAAYRRIKALNEEYLKPLPENIYSDNYKWLEENIDNYDLIVTTRAHDPIALSTLLAVREHKNIPYIMDFDDYYNKCPEYNIAYKTSNPQSDYIQFAMDCLRKANAAQTPSEFLQSEFKPENNKIYFCPNFVDPVIWDHPQRDRNDDKIKVIIAAATGRYGDYMHIKPILEWMLDKWNNTQLIFMGSIPDFAMEYPQDRTFRVKWAMIPYYMKVLRYITADIGLAPMVENDFNKGKSNLKYLDYAMSKIPAIYQNIEPYHCVEHGETGLIANGEQAWKDCIQQLVEDRSLREKIRKQAHEDVMTNYTGDKLIGKYEQAYKEVIANGNSGIELYNGQTEGLQRSCDDSCKDCRRE